jgi:3',5'-cyclic AMP phosphodiesterase CpdA
VSDPFVLMHISDLHFHRLPVRAATYLSKRALGALSLLLLRRRTFPPQRQRRLVERLLELDWQHLLITGDLTQLGTAQEMALARQVLAPLLARGAERVTVIPGNHDRYVPEPGGQGAYDAAFADFAGTNGLRTVRLTEHWWLAAWDSAMPRGPISAAGRVPRATLAATEAWLAALPSGAQVIVANHYPVLFPPPHRHRRTHDLLNQDEVLDWLQGHPVRLYLHGHVHHNWVVTAPGRHGQLTAVNSASSTQVPRPRDASAFHRIVLEGPAFRIEPQQFE